ncbi:MAG TPA: hypothetical protein VHV79_08140 [Mycobacteriales bacterium]|jgi:hypothetical protein|nr:hypothetical protein [Mycobacteriales bacterium]
MNLTPLALASVSLATGAALIASPASAAPAGHTRVVSSCTTAKYKPSSYILTCADANTQIRHATYSSWSPKHAEGIGSYVYNTCLPSCAAGTFKHHPVSFTLYRARTVSGKKLFTRMSVSYAGLTEVFQLPTSGV